MKVVVAGSGAREHAIAWKVSQSTLVSELIAAPGNPGMETLGRTVAQDPLDGAAFARWARATGADLVIVGPDDPIAMGLIDACEAAGVPAFGPTAAAAQIEASKVFAKELMSQHSIPTAPYRVFDQAGAAHRYLDAPGRDYPVVVKADGLARGKGAIVAADRAAAHAAVAAMLETRVFGAAGDRILIEECLVGPEASVFAICDGERAWPCGAARDYKRIGEGDRGPNTGGMGAYAPTNLVPPAVLEDVRQRILQPTVEALAAAGRPYRGVLYAGLMFTADGPQVIEFNARWGDPGSTGAPAAAQERLCRDRLGRYWLAGWTRYPSSGTMEPRVVSHSPRRATQTRCATASLSAGWIRGATRRCCFTPARLQPPTAPSAQPAVGCSPSSGQGQPWRRPAT